jgi:hypothetical protein
MFRNSVKVGTLNFCLLFKLSSKEGDAIRCKRQYGYGW